MVTPSKRYRPDGLGWPALFTRQSAAAGADQDGSLGSRSTASIRSRRCRAGAAGDRLDRDPVWLVRRRATGCGDACDAGRGGIWRGGRPSASGVSADSVSPNSTSQRFRSTSATGPARRFGSPLALPTIRPRRGSGHRDPCPTLRATGTGRKPGRAARREDREEAPPSPGDRGWSCPSVRAWSRPRPTASMPRSSRRRTASASVAEAVPEAERAHPLPLPGREARRLAHRVRRLATARHAAIPAATTHAGGMAGIGGGAKPPAGVQRRGLGSASLTVEDITDIKDMLGPRRRGPAGCRHHPAGPDPKQELALPCQRPRATSPHP
jgi:hypothetical protein